MNEKGTQSKDKSYPISNLLLSLRDTQRCWSTSGKGVTTDDALKFLLDRFCMKVELSEKRMNQVKQLFKIIYKTLSLASVRNMKEKNNLNSITTPGLHVRLGMKFYAFRNCKHRLYNLKQTRSLMFLHTCQKHSSSLRKHPQSKCETFSIACSTKDNFLTKAQYTKENKAL